MSESAAVLRYRQEGYRAGYDGREPRPVPDKRLRDVYRKAYRAGEGEWLSDQATELEAWKVAHCG